MSCQGDYIDGKEFDCQISWRQTPPWFSLLPDAQPTQEPDHRARHERQQKMPPYSHCQARSPVATAGKVAIAAATRL